MTGPFYADVWRLACREALAVEKARGDAWRRDMARKERESIARGELRARDAIWQGGER